MIQSSIDRVIYTGDGVTTGFPFSTTVLAQTDIVVTEETIATGATVVKSLGSDYTIEGTTDAAGRYVDGVTVRATIAPSSSVRWAVYQDPPVTQLVDLVDNGLLPVETQIELPLDRLTVIAQRTRSLVERAIGQPDTDVSDIARLPSAASRASKFLAFDSDGDPIAAAGDIRRLNSCLRLYEHAVR